MTNIDGTDAETVRVPLFEGSYSESIHASDLKALALRTLNRQLKENINGQSRI